MRRIWNRSLAVLVLALATSPAAHGGAPSKGHATAHQGTLAPQPQAGAPLPAGWVLPAGKSVASGVQRPTNAAALKALPKTHCSPVEVAPNVWITPLCRPMEKLSKLAFVKALPPLKASAKAALPSAADLLTQGLDGPIKDQGQAGVCWAMAISTVMDNAVRRAGRSDVFTPLHVVAHDEWSLLHHEGAGHPIVTDTSWPYDPHKACKLDAWVSNEHYCKDAYGITGGSWRDDPDLVTERTRAENSGDFKILALQSLDSRATSGKGNASQVMDLLASGQAIWSNIELNMGTWSRASASNGGVMPDWEPDGTGGHAVVIAGYRTANGQPQFKIHNSWGTSWGDGGYAWMSERMLQERLNDAWVVTVGDKAGNPIQPSSSGTLKLYITDDGQTFKVKSGQTITVSLATKPSSGLDWTVARDGGLGPAAQASVPPSDDTDGGAGMRTFTWRAPSDAGDHLLELAKRRGWEGSPTVRTFRVTLRIE